MDELRLISRAAAADLLDCSERTLLRLENAGELTPVRVGKRVKYALRDISAYQERQRHAGNGKEETEADVPVHAEAASGQD